MAISVVQCQTNTVTTATAVTVTITSQTGNLLIAFCGESANNTSTVTMSDSAGNTYAQIGTYASGGSSQRAGMFYVLNATGVTSVTCTWSGSLSTRVGATVLEVTGYATSSVEDGSTHGGGASVTSLASQTIATTAGGDLLVYGVYNPSGGGDALTNGFTFPTNGIGNRVDVGTDVSGSAGNYSTTLSWTTAGTVSGNFGAFKAGSGGAASFAPDEDFFPFIMPAICEPFVSVW